jgi:hypothetical protein
MSSQIEVCQVEVDQDVEPKTLSWQLGAVSLKDI